MKKRYMGTVLGTVLFTMMVLAGFLLSIKSIVPLLRDGFAVYIGDGAKSAITSMETAYNGLFSQRNEFLNLFGLTQRILLKKETRNFEVLRSNDGQLYLSENGWPEDEETILQCVDQIETLRNAAEAHGGKFLFVQVPYKNAGMAEDLSFYTDDRTEEAETRLLNLLQKRSITALDLRGVPQCAEYYKTDHHWTVDAGFHSAAAVASAIDEFGWAEIPDLYSISSTSNYNRREWENSFLGSIGIKVGSMYAGRDDFSVLDPCFDTALEFHHFRDGKQTHNYSGPFWETMIDQSLLDNDEYNNKHAALMHGGECYVESVVENYMAPNEKSVLCITHSYGRSMCAYLSLYFGKMISLDPQKGRFNNSFLRYIQEKQPDIVIFAYNDLVSMN